MVNYAGQVFLRVLFWWYSSLLGQLDKRREPPPVWVIPYVGREQEINVLYNYYFAFVFPLGGNPVRVPGHKLMDLSKDFKDSFHNFKL